MRLVSHRYTNTRRWATIGCVTVLLCGTGCVSPWWNDFLNPSELGNFREARVTEILRSSSFRDTPKEISGTTDPTPEDLVALVEAYKIGPGDMVEIRILDLLAKDAESVFQPRVDDLGWITVSQLGHINVEGLTARDLELELKNKAKEKGIFGPDYEPTVLVSVLDQRQRLFNLSGAVRQSGMYAMPRSDYRLQEAINQGGGLDDLVRWVYVTRDQLRPLEVRDTSKPYSTGAPLPTAGQHGTTPPVSPAFLSEMAGSPNPPSAGTGTPGDRATAVREDIDTAEARRELEEVLELPGNQGGPVTDPNEAQPPFIFVNDRFIEAPKTDSQDPAPVPVSEPVAAPAPTPEIVDWAELVAEGRQRIIKIPADKLRQSDSNYNIVIRPGDWIRLETGPTGSYYVMGHVRSPGNRSQLSYAFGGEDVTIRQALASVGGLDPLAWPSRCELARKLEGDRVEITQWNLARIIDGRDPDIYLKPGDVVNVGTHAMAMLLYKIRNGFRLGYGFDFSYSRNFADIDSFGGQVNPDTRRRADLQRRFPNLF
ncbi:MAG: hypothetical protein GXY44_12935 [Phycisphaerales bacterium]|nr:hypothetical protein [Phycisphaerales bacterium]